MAKAIKFKPLYDNILVRPIAVDAKTDGGIIIPDTAKEKPKRGEIVAIGKGKQTKSGNILPMQAKVGDKILFGQYAATEVKLFGEEFFLMQEADIVGVLEER